MKVAIIDYGSGNLKSAASAFRDAAAASGAEVIVTDVAETLKTAEAIVLPGVGAFADCMRGLTSIPGMVAAMEEKVLQQKTPFLGICVGMQLLFTRGLEHGTHAGLDWLQGEVAPIAPKDPALKVPHMGWNNLALQQKTHPLLKNIHDGDHAYFVHSFHAVLDARENLLATVDYGGTVTAIVAKENIFGTQFHPEKSQTTGMALIHNFLEIAGTWPSK